MSRCMPILSIIVPVYKVEKFLPTCIESILGQLFNDFELILVDDGSPDASGDVCDAYAKNDSRIVVIHKENGGIVSARKAGLAVANGEYIGFVDSDDWIDKEMFSFLVSVAQKYDCDLVASGFVFHSKEKDKIIKDNVPFGLYSSDERINSLQNTAICNGTFFEFGMRPNLVTKLFKKDILKNIIDNTNPKITMGEDVSVAYPYLCKCQKVYISDKSFYHYRSNEGSVTFNYDKDLWRKNEMLIEVLREKCIIDGVDFSNQIRAYDTYMTVNAAYKELFFSQDSLIKRFLSVKKELKNHKIAIKATDRNIFSISLKKQLILFCLRNRLILPFYLIYLLKM